MSTLSPAAKKRMWEACERGYLVDTHKSQRPKLSNAWWEICGRRGLPFLRMERKGRFANVILDMSTAKTAKTIPCAVLDLMLRSAERYGLKWKLCGSSNDSVATFRDGNATALHKGIHCAAITRIPAEHAERVTQSVLAQLGKLMLV